MRKRVFFHVGPPKTGTTYLQGCMWANREVLQASGIDLPGDAQIDHFHAGSDLRGRKRDEGAQPIDGAWSRLIEQATTSPFPTVVVTDERLASASREATSAARETLKGHDVHLIYVMREFAGLVISAWAQQLRWRELPDLPVWIDEVAAGERPGFGRLYDPQDVFARWGLPPDHVHVMTIPQGSRDPRELWSRFASIIGAPDALPNDPPLSNESVGLDEIALLRLIHAHRPPHGLREHTPKTRADHLMRGMLARRVLAGRPSSRPNTMPERCRPWVEEQAAAHRRYLASSSYDIIGDLDDLAVARRRFAQHPAEPDRNRILDAALDAIAELVHRYATMRVRYTRQLHQHGTETPAPRSWEDGDALIGDLEPAQLHILDEVRARLEGREYPRARTRVTERLLAGVLLPRSTVAVGAAPRDEDRVLEAAAYVIAQLVEVFAAEETELRDLLGRARHIADAPGGTVGQPAGA